MDGDRAVIPTTESEGRLNRMEDAIARLGSTLERFINKSSSIKRGDERSIRGYLTEFSVNASQSEIKGNSSDEEDPPQQRCNRGSRNGDINALLPAKETESRQVGDAGHQTREGREKVSIFDEINKEKMSEEEVGPAISDPTSCLRWHTSIGLMKPRIQLSLVKLWRGWKSLAIVRS